MSFDVKNAMLVGNLSPVKICSTFRLGSLSVGPPGAAGALVLWITGAGRGDWEAGVELVGKTKGKLLLSLLGIIAVISPKLDCKK